MCESCVPPYPGNVLSRRRLIGGALVAGAVAAFGVRPTWAAPVQVGTLQIHPRSDWGADMTPGPLQPEPDVEFLLVHHTAGSNDYSATAVKEQIRQVFQFHTGPEKQWPDVCYNFFVDRYGGIWEGRAGSLDGPVMADATGGSQGFAQLVCLLGNFVSTPPTPEMVDSTVGALAYLADRYAIDTSPGATVEFISRGSNKWPAGRSVRARTISGHRDMSATECPGQKVYDLLAQEIPARVTELRGSASAPPTVPAPAAPPPTVPSSTLPLPTVATSTSQPATTTSIAVTTTSPVTTVPSIAAPSSPASPSASVSTSTQPAATSNGTRSWALPTALAAAGTGLLAVGVARRQRTGNVDATTPKNPDLS